MKTKELTKLQIGRLNERAIRQSMGTSGFRYEERMG